MWRFLLYLFPALSNMFASGVMFITAYRLSEAHCPKLLVTGTLAVWGILYSLLSLLAGRLTNSRRAPWMLIGSCVVLFCVAWGFILFPGLYLQFLWLALCAVGFSFYCVPFQVFGKDLEEGKHGGTVRVASFYTVAWSWGMASGPMFFGLLTDWKQAFAYLSLLPIFTILGTIAILHLRKGRTASIQANTEIEEEFRDMPDFALIGLLGGLLGTLAVTIIRVLEPNLAVEHGISQFHAGAMLAALSYVQGAVALMLLRSRRWMYRPACFLGCAILGVAGLLLYAFASSVPMLYLGSVLYGLCSGSFYFLLTFHSQVNPLKNTRYVALTETLVGIANVCGPLLGGWIAQLSGLREAFLLAAGLMLLMGILQFVFGRKILRKAR